MTTTQTTFIKAAVALVVVVALSTIAFGEAYGYGSSSGTRATKRTPANSPLVVNTPAPQVLGTSTYQFSTDLYEGMQSEEVRQLQERLRAEGFFTFPTSTGYFGPITRAAVAAYQTAKGITPAAGYFGPITRASLNAS